MSGPKTEETTGDREDDSEKLTICNLHHIKEDRTDRHTVCIEEMRIA
jgi:hypothetical protein